jgi:hypothetical protein
MVDDAGDFKCGLGIESLGSLVLALRHQLLQQGCLIFL